MAKYTISQITLLNGDIAELKDKVAREAVSGGTYFMGVTTTSLTDGSTTTTIVIDGDSKTASNGAIAVYGNKEFIYAESDLKWHELGDVTNLGALALKDSATGVYTPTGTVSQPTFSGTNISYTPVGSVTAPNITVTPTTANVKEFDGAGSVSAGTAASCTMPVLTITPDANENLTIAWTDGSFTANVPTSVTLPTSKETAVMTGAAAALESAPVFTGTSEVLPVVGTVSQPTFSGTQATIVVT